PVEYFGFYCAAEDVGVDLLLATFGYATIDRAFVCERHYFATGTATAGVRSCFGRQISISSDEWTALPVVGLLRVVDAGSVVATHQPGTIDLGGVGLLPDAAHLVVDDTYQTVTARAAGMIAGSSHHSPQTIHCLDRI